MNDKELKEIYAKAIYLKYEPSTKDGFVFIGRIWEEFNDINLFSNGDKYYFTRFYIGD